MDKWNRYSISKALFDHRRILQQPCRRCRKQEIFYSVQYIATAAILVIAAMMSGCYSQPKEQKIPVRVLILPKFELDKITGDFPGEAQFFYEEYLAGRITLPQAK